MWLPARSDKTTIKRILRVNHAGETGAVKIYAAQIALAKRRFPEAVQNLEEMLDDEIRHRDLFLAAMPARGTRPCNVLRLWSAGGYLLGYLTALLGEQTVWACTEAVEATVHRHMDQQIAYLKSRDDDLLELIQSIRDEEIAHLNDAISHQTGKHPLHGVIVAIVGAATEVMIWLSTHGDTIWMRGEMERSSNPDRYFPSR